MCGDSSIQTAATKATDASIRFSRFRLLLLSNRSQHPVNCCVNNLIKFLIVCFWHQCCCVFIRNKFNKITEGFFVFSLRYNIEYYTELSPGSYHSPFRKDQAAAATWDTVHTYLESGHDVCDSFEEFISWNFIWPWHIGFFFS